MYMQGPVLTATGRESCPDMMHVTSHIKERGNNKAAISVKSESGASETSWAAQGHTRVSPLGFKHN